MARTRRLDIVIAGDASGANRAFGAVDDKAGKTQKKLSGFKKAMGVAFAGGAVAAFKFGTDSVKAFAESEKSQAQLSNAFAKFPALAGGNIDKLRELNTTLASKTKFDDDATASGQAMLAQFGLTADQIAEATPLLQDYAARTGKDLPSAARDFGKAVNGQGKVLSKVGVKFKDAGNPAANFTQIMGGLQDKVGGFASNEGKTLEGRMAIMKNQFGEVQEKVGAALVPVLVKLGTIITETVIPAVSKIGSWLADHKPVLIAFAIAVGVGLVAAFVAWATSAAAAAAATIAATWPIIAVIAVIAALVAGVIYAYKHWGWFRKAVDAVARFFKEKLWPALKSVGAWIKDTLIPTIGRVIGIFGRWIGKAASVASGIKDKIGKVVSFVTGLPGKISKAAKGMFDPIAHAFRGIVNSILRAWNGLDFGIHIKVPSWVPGVGGKGFDVDDIFPDVPLLAKGGIITRPTLIGAGEAGPEAIIPLSKLGGVGGSSLTIDARGAHFYSKMDLERFLADTLQQAARHGFKFDRSIVRA